MDKRPEANMRRGEIRRKQSIARILNAIESANAEKIEITNQYLEQTTGLRTRQLNTYKKTKELKPYFSKTPRVKVAANRNATTDETAANIALVRALAEATKQASEREEEIRKLKKRGNDKTG